MTIRAGAILGLMMFLPAIACGGSPPTAPTRTCEPIVGPTSPTLSAGDLFRFRFTVSSGADADVLVTFMGEGADGLSRSAMSVRLYDGTNLLGALDEYQDSVALWKSPTSPFSASNSNGAPAVVLDFRTIVTGTIDGRVEFSVTRGSVSVQRLDLATVMLLRSTDLAAAGTPMISARELCR
jgi:hypothetical protein